MQQLAHTTPSSVYPEVNIVANQRSQGLKFEINKKHAKSF